MKMTEKFQEFTESFTASDELNLLPEEYGGIQIFAKPLVGISQGDDYIFRKFKEVVGPEHLTPAEMWIQSGFPAEERLETRLRVVSVVFPYASQIREAGKKNGQNIPSEICCVAYNFSSPFKNAVLRETLRFFREQGFRAISGIQSEAFKYVTKQDPFRTYSNWSERHVAFAAGLGTFSLHEALITEKGCNVMIASVITDAPLETTVRISDEPYANCLYLTHKVCGKCMVRCPAGAITGKGHDKLKCSEYRQKVILEMHKKPFKAILRQKHRKVGGENKISYPVGCALCQFGVPCTDKNPMVTRNRTRNLNSYS